MTELIIRQIMLIKINERNINERKNQRITTTEMRTSTMYVCMDSGNIMKM